MSPRRLLATAGAALLVAAALAAPGRGAGAAGLPRASTAAYAPVVQSMIVGVGGRVLAGPWSVAAAPTTLSVRGRACAVAGGTPLAVLAADRHAGGPGFAIRDYGRCGPSPANAGQLFVYFIGGERNRGQSGWEYKVGGAAGSTGAGDPSGPSGDGRRIRAGERVLWFWCQAAGSGCQRTLEVSAPASVAPGARVRTTVYGYDDNGRGAPVAGALVALGGARASTTRRGQATLVAPSRRGRYELSATRAGMVPPFPVSVVVR